MNDTLMRKIKTGSDPRALQDYSSLRDEISKLTHPARPDVNWHYAEKLCLSLFEQNGVELQTAAWYTLARSQRAGLPGLNEGLSILEALINHQWGELWPQPVHTRMEILCGLSQRLQQLMRTLPLNDSDLSQLYRAEQLLTSLGATLQRLELKPLKQLDALLALVRNSFINIGKSDGAAIQSVIPSTEQHDPANTVKWVYVAQPEHQPNVEVLAAMPVPVKKWKSFAAGILASVSAIAEAFRKSKGG